MSMRPARSGKQGPIALRALRLRLPRDAASVDTAAHVAPPHEKDDAGSHLANATIAAHVAGEDVNGSRRPEKQNFSQEPIPSKPEALPWQSEGNRETKRTDEESIPQEQRVWLGVPKILWAVALDIIAMLAFIACIPFILTIAKRRRAIPSSQS